MVRHYLVLPIDKTSDFTRTTKSGLVITCQAQSDGRELWTYDYSNCSY